MKKYYMLVCLIAFNCQLYSKDTYEEKQQAPELNVSDNQNNNGRAEDPTLDKHELDYFDTLANMDIRYIETPPQQPFHAHLPSWVKQFGITLLLKYVAFTTALTKNFRVMKKKLLHTAIRIYAHRKA